MIIAYYNERIIPEKLEEGVLEHKYFEAWIPFRCEAKKAEIKNIQKVVGLNEDEVKLVIKPESKGVVFNFKKHDKIRVNNQVYLVLELTKDIPEKHKFRVSRNPHIFNRYVEYTLYLGV